MYVVVVVAFLFYVCCIYRDVCIVTDRFFGTRLLARSFSFYMYYYFI